MIVPGRNAPEAGVQVQQVGRLTEVTAETNTRSDDPTSEHTTAAVLLLVRKGL